MKTKTHTHHKSKHNRNFFWQKGENKTKHKVTKKHIHIKRKKIKQAEKAEPVTTLNPERKKKKLAFKSGHAYIILMMETKK